MTFQSAQFLIFFPIVCLVYYFLPRIARKYWLLAASIYFYVSFTPIMVLFLVGIIGVTYFLGLWIGKNREKGGRFGRSILALSILISFLPLLLFKYGEFIRSNVVQLLKLIGIQTGDKPMSLLAPLGLSFISFAAVGYLIDIYRQKRMPERNIVNYALFLSFFPTVMSGPIERSDNLLKQIDNSESIRLDTNNLRHGLLTMAYGFFLKLVIADRISIPVNTVFANHTAYGGGVLALAIVGFGIQLYCDFAGISTIALGAGEMLGFSLINNFKAPYLSLSVSEFWRRWHISLSSWFRDYLYIPLGGNRKGKLRKRLNNMIVFLVSGAWHGAGWTFIIWGGLNGLYLVLSDMLKPWRDLACRWFHIERKNFGNRCFRLIFTFVLIQFAWLFFRATDLNQAGEIMRTLFTSPNLKQITDGTLMKLGLDGAEWAVLIGSLILLTAADYQEYKEKDWRQSILNQGFLFRCIVYVAIFVILLLFAQYGPGFDAGSSIYVDF